MENVEKRAKLVIEKALFLMEENRHFQAQVMIEVVQILLDRKFNSIQSLQEFIK